MVNKKQIKQLAASILRNSINLQPGEKVYLETTDINALPLFEALIEETSRLGGVPFYYLNDISFTNKMLKDASEEQIAVHGQIHQQIMSKMDAWVGIRNFNNPLDVSEPGIDKVNLYQKNYTKPVHFETRCKRRWCLLRYPNAVWAYQAGMTTSEFEDFYFKSCLADYAAMGEAMKPLLKLMEHTDKVHILAPETDLTFSIKNIPAVPCNGVRNLPDGEVFTAPILDSVNGRIRFNTRAEQAGKSFSNISLEFCNGRIINAYSDINNEALQKIICSDEGCRRLGEFAMGVNPYITSPVGNTLFDEKIAGSLHFAVGAATEQAPNGNHAPIHWDLIQIQTPEYGGGKIWFDDVLIRDNGHFVIEELKGLNPENLV